MAVPERASVLIVGGGPCGLTLANELGRRGVDAVVVDEKSGTAFNPQANATQARTMEHYRRLGIAQEIRAAGLPPDYPTDIAYFTRYAGYELARFALPSAAAATRMVKGLDGSWSAAELPHRVSQKYVEAILLRHAAALPGIDVNYGWRLLDFIDEGADGIAARIQCVATGDVRPVRSRYLVGADGPRSVVRQNLGIAYGGKTGFQRDFMGGRMLAVYVRAPEFKQRIPHPPAWMYVCFNRDRRAFMAAVNGVDEYAFHTQLRPGEEEAALTEADARRAFQRACGTQMPCEVLSYLTWTAGHALVAERLAHGNVFLAGDAAHLFTPTGGLGYNTAVSDAVNLGWKLASVIKGIGGAMLLDSYEAEQRPVAVRNTGFAGAFADSLGLYAAVPEIEEAGEAGEAARREAGIYFDRHARAEFNIPGVTFGARYDGSPVIVADGTEPPHDAANTYTPSACPGGRAPHAWLADGTSLFDHFGFEWTLLDFSARPEAGATFREAAALLGVECKLVDAPAGLRPLYEADLALVRPDQVVAWRGAAPTPGEALGIFRQVLGH